MLGKVSMAATPLLMGAAIVQNAEEKKDSKSKALICKPSELPLYTPLNATHSCGCTKKYTPSKPVAAIEDGIRIVRVQACDLVKSVSNQQKHVVDLIEEGKKQTKFIHDYLNEEDNTMPRIGAIAIGGVAGLIFGIRGGFIRRALYSSIGAGAVASICYPKEAEMYTQHGLIEGKKYATIGYNFVYGVKPGDKQLELPHVPLSLSELKNTMTDFAKSTYETVFPVKK